MKTRTSYIILILSPDFSFINLKYTHKSNI